MGHQIVGGQVIGQWFDAQGLVPCGVVELGRRQQQHETETARVVKVDARPPAIGLGGDDLDVQVFFGGDKLVVVGAEAGVAVVDIEPAGHAEVRHPDLLRVEPGQQVLGAPLQPDDRSAVQGVRESLGEGVAQIGAMQANVGQLGAFEKRRQTAPDGFDFGEFGHGAPQDKGQGP